MSPFAALLSTFLFFSSFVVSQPENAITCTSWGTEWMSNGLGQNGCTIAWFLLSTCNRPIIDPLLPGQSYMGPSPPEDSNLCMCNTVAYSLLSACDACQGEPVIPWSEYSSNCRKILPPSTFPNPVPPETWVPQWALIDVIPEDTWDENKAFSAGTTPELGPGTRIGAKRSYTGVIIGSVVGGVAAISLVIAISFFLRRRRRKASVVAAPVVGASQPPMNEIQQPLTIEDRYTVSSTGIPGTIGSSSASGTPAVLEPNNPSTFPGYQRDPHTPAMSQGAAP